MRMSACPILLQTHEDSNACCLQRRTPASRPRFSDTLSAFTMRESIARSLVTCMLALARSFPRQHSSASERLIDEMGLRLIGSASEGCCAAGRQHRSGGRGARQVRDVIVLVARTGQ